MIMKNNVKPGESERFVEMFSNNMLENHDSYGILDFLKAKRKNRAGYMK